jgi:DNA-binding Lrp family transcriptional regulator
MSLDDIDARIVTALIRDARASYSVIGSEVGLSAPAVKRRVDRLRASGAITGFSARVNPAALGWTTEAYVELFCGGRTSPEEIADAVRKYPEVADACTVTGDADALIHIRAADVKHFERVMERIGAEPFVVRTRSVIVLSRLVERADSIVPSEHVLRDKVSFHVLHRRRPERKHPTLPGLRAASGRRDAVAVADARLGVQGLAPDRHRCRGRDHRRYHGEPVRRLRPG